MLVIQSNRQAIYRLPGRTALLMQNTHCLAVHDKTELDNCRVCQQTIIVHSLFIHYFITDYFFVQNLFLDCLDSQLNCKRITVIQNEK